MGFHYSVYYISIEQEVAYFPFENHIEIIVSSGVIMSNCLVPVSSQNGKRLRHCTSHMPANPVLASGTEFAGGGGVFCIPTSEVAGNNVYGLDKRISDRVAAEEACPHPLPCACLAGGEAGDGARLGHQCG